ncbi:HEAT repeat domain-containing protein [Paenibacillus sp. MABNR03]|uniref:HEAT repeat domain-containing protein n=1 Tax=Paenibacillus sp. MABNR03 TaxID=3142626 RepID=UPI003D2E88CD
MHTNIKQEILSQEDTEEALQRITHIGENKDISKIHFLIKLLETTENNVLRNQTAIALSDLGDERAVEPLIQAIMDPRTVGSRGTLLYALENLDYILHIEHIIPSIGDTSLDVCAQSFMLLEQLKDRLSDEQILRCQQVIEHEIKHNERKLLVVALDMLQRWR